MSMQELRKEYENAGIDEAKLPACPIACFRQWFESATEHCPGRWFEPNAMSLATADKGGRPSVRVVLLKEITDTGIQFFTNYESTKGQQLAANPVAAVTMHWPYLGRQVRMIGDVEKTSRDVSEAYFHSRPRGSQIGALASRQSCQVDSRDELDREARELTEKLEGQDVPLPEHWGGYHLVPTEVEFWQGRLDRLHDRIVYSKSERNSCSWEIGRLSP
jgi:pyridoxamine-phosphate oxidase